MWDRTLHHNWSRKIEKQGPTSQENQRKFLQKTVQGVNSLKNSGILSLDEKCVAFKTNAIKT